MDGICNSTIFWVPTPWVPGEGPKGQILLNLNYKVNFKVFLNQTLCIFLQIKDIKHIRQDFPLSAWVMPRGGALGYRGGLGVKKINSEIQPDLVCELLP